MTYNNTIKPPLNHINNNINKPKLPAAPENQQLPTPPTSLTPNQTTHHSPNKQPPNNKQNYTQTQPQTHHTNLKSNETHHKLPNTKPRHTAPPNLYPKQPQTQTTTPNNVTIKSHQNPQPNPQTPNKSPTNHNHTTKPTQNPPYQPHTNQSGSPTKS